MEPFAGKAKLISPAITNGGAPMGVAWMKDFLQACSGCHIDGIAMHWYDSATVSSGWNCAAKRRLLTTRTTTEHRLLPELPHGSLQDVWKAHLADRGKLVSPAVFPPHH